MKKLLFILFATTLFAGPSMTGDMLLKFYRIKDTEARPGLSMYHQTEHFRVWYDTTGNNAVEDLDIDPANGLPDYVEKTGTYLEQAWQMECVELGFREPLPDSQTYASIDPFVDVGGDNRWDVYLSNMSGGFYGATFIDHSIDSAGHEFATGYMKINSDMRSLYGYEDDPYPALAVTCAHEFQHMIQFHYRHGDNFVWQMEATATFMEEYVFDEVNDYYNYVPRFQQDPQKPLNSRGNLYEYGSVIFPIYLAENFGPEIIVDWWDKSQLRFGFQALDLALSEHGTDLNTEFANFALWTFHTGRAYIEDFGFEEGANYPMPSISDTIQRNEISFDGMLNGPYSTGFTFIPMNEALARQLEDAGFSCELTPHSPDSLWSFIYAGLGPIGGDQQQGHLSDSLSGTIAQLWRYDGLVFAPVYLDGTTSYYTLNFTDTGIDTTQEPEKGPASAFPDPASGFIYIPFYADADAEVTIVIYDVSGSIISETSHSVEQGPHFDRGAIGIDISGLASGPYTYIFIMDGESWKDNFIVK